jgi:hypothetical protein
MDFEYSAEVQTLEKRLIAFMDEHVYPNEQRYEEEIQTGDRWQPPGLIEELSGGVVEPVPSGFALWSGTDQPRIRTALRDHGPRRMGVRGIQLLRARHRQYGNA